MLLASIMDLTAAKVSMTKDAFIKEHKHLIPTLRKGTKKERNDEADEQQEELDKIKAGKGVQVEMENVRRAFAEHVNDIVTKKKRHA